MAISDPRSLLSGFDMVESTFTLIEGVSISRTDNNRVISTIGYADSYWQASFSTEPLDIDDRRRWSAWHKSLRGGLRTFLAYDFMRPFPAAYPDGIPAMLSGSPPWNGQGPVDSLDASTIVASGVPVGFTLTDGDHVGLVEGGRYHVFECVETAVATSGGQITVTVDPFIPTTVFTAAAVAVFYRPTARFIIAPGSFQCPGVGGLANVSWEALQII